MILGIDVGGTHTDAVLIEGSSVTRKAKVPTDETNLLSSLLAVTTELLHEGNIGRLERVVLSTTLSTNAIVQNKVDRVALVLVSGPGLPPSLLDVGNDAFFISGYTNHRGIEVTGTDPGEIERIVGRLESEGIRHAAVIAKFSTRNPAQELRIAGMIRDASVHLSLGHRMSGHLNFPRRIATAYLNEAVSRRYHRFVTEVLHFVRERKIDVPIYILKADGGTFEIGHSLDFPVQTILSGPAASIMGILTMGGCREDAIALDIGGTTTDIAVFADGVPLLEAFGVTIEGRRTLIRGLRTQSVGIGGDSAVRIALGKLLIGPEREGPAAAFGGPLPTPTDAMILLGLSDLGDRGKAGAAFLPLAREMGCPVEEAAARVFREMCARIAGRVREVIAEINAQPVYTIHELLEGKKLTPHLLYVVGGPAGPMAQELGRLLDCEVRIPPHAEVANAIGAALARTTAEMTLLADTEQRTLTIAEEGLQDEIPPRFTREDAIRIGCERLRKKALEMGAAEEDLEIEVVEAQEFNMVRECYTTGKNIRVKVQIKPGPIAGFRLREAAC